jgi:hypothetical protein
MWRMFTNLSIYYLSHIVYLNYLETTALIEARTSMNYHAIINFYFGLGYEYMYLYTLVRVQPDSNSKMSTN